MGGFGGAFSAAVVGMVFVLAASSLTSLSLSSIYLISHYTHAQAEESRISIDGGEIVDLNRALVNLTLLSSSIKVSDFGRIDLFVLYQSSGSTYYERLSYPGSWSVSRVFTSGLEGEAANPIRGTTGIWDSGETIEALIRMSHPIDPGSIWSVVLSAPDGGRCSKSFSYEIEGGEGKGETMTPGGTSYIIACPPFVLISANPFVTTHYPPEGASYSPEKGELYFEVVGGGSVIVIATGAIPGCIEYVKAWGTESFDSDKYFAENPVLLEGNILTFRNVPVGNVTFLVCFSVDSGGADGQATEPATDQAAETSAGGVNLDV
ncbi:MAG: hypothetical protein QFX35_06165 [Candidatus Verstraetearchaeota archaeon]|nr:hypothetical protein [Candidatus Verstraetearchaeota archaeon]